ncbi:MAG: FAD-dependent oxidoreductase [Clostridia bacterium]|nr:FAD-dependent oxidoreductase [Clostridia bacterium]
MKKYDLIVLGGGISGVAAAVSAARQGLSVLLIEKYGHLGGAMSNSLVYPFMPYTVRGEGGKDTNKGLFTEMVDRFAEYNEHSWEFYKFVFDDIVKEAGAEVLFHATVIEAKTDGRDVKKVSVATKSGIIEIEADFFIDASGDGELIYMTGCGYQLGRESDNYCQPMTTCFRICNVDVKLFNSELYALNKLYIEQREKGLMQNPREDILVFYGLGEDVIHFNTTRVVKHNPVDPFEITEAEIIARKQVLEMFKFLKENAQSCKKAELISIASHIGVRESRKLKGEHILTGEELKNTVDFEDTIALGCYSIDIHNPTGTGTTLYHFKEGEYYKIPYRCLLPKEYDNMLVAGRCISANHEAHSAIRIMPICASLGEAAGIAVSVAKKTGSNAHTVDIKSVQNTLREVGAEID